MQLVDTHCHLQFDKLKARLDNVLADARDVGVKKIICVGTSLGDSADMVALAAEHEGIWAAAGVHPHDSLQYLADKEATKKLDELLASPKIVAIGEIGLDFYKDYADEATQIQALKAQLEIATKHNLPVIFHVRDAFRDFWPILDEYEIKRAVVHSFTAGTKTLKQILERGYYVSLNGIMTFTKDHAQLDAAKQVPLERLLLETDAPFLTPKPAEGICEPKHLPLTANFLADLRGESLEKLAAATTKNAEELFGI